MFITMSRGKNSYPLKIPYPLVLILQFAMKNKGIFWLSYNCNENQGQQIKKNLKKCWTFSILQNWGGKNQLLNVLLLFNNLSYKLKSKQFNSNILDQRFSIKNFRDIHKYQRFIFYYNATSLPQDLNFFKESIYNQFTFIRPLKQCERCIVFRNSNCYNITIARVEFVWSGRHCSSRQTPFSSLAEIVSIIILDVQNVYKAGLKRINSKTLYILVIVGLGIRCITKG